MSTQDPKLLKLVADYKLNLIEPAAMGAEDLEKLHSNLRSVLGFIKYSNDREELSAFLSRDSGLQALDVKAAKVIKACSNAKIQINEKERSMNVCKAVQEMNDIARQEGREEGRLEGREEGRLEGREEGRLEGREEGRLEGRQEARLETMLDNVKNLMASLHLSVDEAMKALQIGAEDQAILMKKI